MFETSTTVVGRIITDPRRRLVAGQEVISFRVAANSRRRTAEGTWEPGNTLYITVNCWGRLVTGVGAALYKGGPGIATGIVHTSEDEEREGAKRSSLEMRATVVGPDLYRVIVRIEQPRQPGSGDAGEATDGDVGEATEGVIGEVPEGHTEEADCSGIVATDVDADDLAISA